MAATPKAVKAAYDLAIRGV
ncbi:TPA: tail fiber protein [Escherichia coli]